MMPLSRRRLLGLAALSPALAMGSVSPAQAAPRARLIDRHWTQVGAADGVDHDAWTAFLQRYRVMGADGVARLRYGAVSAADRAALDGYIAALEATQATALTRSAAYAYWANLYNALTVKLVLEAYPVDSIREVRGGFFNTGPWRDDVATVEGRRLSLDDIEHGVMRPVFRDPRVHYAVNCASIGCPNLDARAFDAAGLDAALDRLAADFVNHPRGAQVESGRLIVSSIYEWFEDDFGGDDTGVIAHLRTHARPPLAAALAGVDRVWDDAYDWALNDAA